MRRTPSRIKSKHCTLLIPFNPAVSQSSPGFIAGRAVAGVGAAGIIGGAYTTITHLVAPSILPIFFGLIGLSFTIASVLGPILGGLFTSHVT